MSKRATLVSLSSEDRFTLERWVRSAKTEQRLAQRGRVILAAAAGQRTTAIARAEGLRPASVSKWRVRFARAGRVGLQDAPRPGAVRRYGPTTERQILAKLDEPPPSGYATWTGAWVARALGDVSKHQVWRVLRGRGIHLQRRRSWCISTDPQFAANIVGLYLDPPENAVVLSVDEKPHIQALERAQGYLKLPHGQAVTGFSHEYKRPGTTTLFAALEVLTGQVRGGHAQRRRRRDFLLSSTRWSPGIRERHCMSSWTTSIFTNPDTTAGGRDTRTCTFTSRPRTPAGSTRSSAGSAS